MELNFTLMTDETLEADLKTHKEIVGALVAERRQRKLDRCGVKVGDIVRSKRRVGGIFRVVGIDAEWQSRAWVTGNPQRKDGTFGTSIRNLFSDWEHVT